MSKLQRYLAEAKKNVDVGFEYIGKKCDKAKITYIHPKAKNLPSWAMMGGEIDVKQITSLEAKWEVFNTDGREIKGGTISEASMKDMASDAAEDVNDLIQNGYDDQDAFMEIAKKYKLKPKQVQQAYKDWY